MFIQEIQDKIISNHISHCGSSKWFYTSKGGFILILRDN